ncbi:hypothetical protein ACGFIW_11120 [Micromonospora sp. NPDC048935]
MIKPFRRRRTAASYCDPCGQTCTPACRAEARYERTRTATLTNHHIR